MPKQNTVQTFFVRCVVGLCIVACADFPLAAAEAAPGDMTVPQDFSVYSPAAGQIGIRTSPRNLPLYFFDEDTPEKSACNRGCLGPWIPVVPSTPSEQFGDWTIIQRDDGREQWAYKGHLLYTYFTDEPGKATGDGQQGKWHLLEP